MDSESGDCHMTPVAGSVVSENYYTALKGEAEGGSDEEPSEAPNIKSPHKPRKVGSHGGRTRDNGTCSKAPGMRRGLGVQKPSRMESRTMENT